MSGQLDIGNAYLEAETLGTSSTAIVCGQVAKRMFGWGDTEHRWEEVQQRGAWLVEQGGCIGEVKVAVAMGQHDTAKL